MFFSTIADLPGGEVCNGGKVCNIKPASNSEDTSQFYPVFKSVHRTLPHACGVFNHSATMPKLALANGCDTSYIVSVHIQCQASIYTLPLCRGHSWRVRLAKQETLTPPGHLVSPLVCRGPWMSTVVFYCWCHSDSASVLLYFTALHREKKEKKKYPHYLTICTL